MQVVYPYELAVKKQDGTARVSVLTDRRGIPRKVDVIEASHPAFGEALKAMLTAWRIIPPYKNGKAMNFAFNYQHKFQHASRDQILTGAVGKAPTKIPDDEASILSSDAIDARPVARYAPPPIDSRDADSATTEETVVVDFIIDPDGDVQLPRIVHTTHEALGWAALTAVQRWIFDVPLQNGVPVYVRHTLRFAFK